MKALDLTGHRFGRLVATRYSGVSGRGGRVWLCVCDCGGESAVCAGYLRSGHSQSCGCGQKEAAAQTCVARSTHRKTGTRIYTIWRAMIQRCEYQPSINFPRYGARGISVCAEWRSSFEAFAVWADAAGYRPDLSIDRINTNGNYEPGNCRWANAKEQANNRNKPRRRAA